MITYVSVAAGGSFPQPRPGMLIHIDVKERGALCALEENRVASPGNCHGTKPGRQNDSEAE